MSSVWVPTRHRATTRKPPPQDTSGGLLAMPGSDFTPNQFNMGRRMAEDLSRHYPGHVWGVNVSQGIVDIRLMSAHTGNWGYTIKHVNSYSASDLDRQVMRAGGELLERYRQRRGRLDEASLLTHGRDAAGRLIPELG